jgi:hypothetical protein
MKSIGGCKAEWIIRWSESQEQFSGSPGPLHTKSKRFASLKNSPDKIAALLAEIGDYEELSANMDSAEDWQGEAGEAAAWLEDYWRVLGESGQAEAGGLPHDDDRILAAPAPDDEDRDDAPGADHAAGHDAAGDDVAGEAGLAVEQARADGLSLPLRYLELARAAQDAGSWTVRMMRDESVPIRLAVYHKLLGASDDTYPDAWLDPATGELPTLQQLAALDQISMPTLRKRRNEAIARLQAAGAR